MVYLMAVGLIADISSIVHVLVVVDPARSDEQWVHCLIVISLLINTSKCNEKPD